MSLLSVVIIARNEERNIGSCIESVLAATAGTPEIEIIVVDSSSTDRTCDIAQRFPIAVVQLKSNWRLTPAAGRYIGTKMTCGDYVLFLDGDMVFCADWLELGLNFLRENGQAAAIAGDLEEVYFDDKGKVIDILEHRHPVTGLTEVQSLGGAGLYRRSALVEVGTFNPFVPLREEAELALRLRRGNYKLFRIPNMMAVHHSPPRETMREIRRRYRAGFYAGFGRAVYYSLRSGTGWRFLQEQGLAYVNTAVFLVIGLISLPVLVALDRWEPLALWLAIAVSVFLAFSLRKRGFENAALGLFSRCLIVYGSIVGILSALGDPPEYPTDVIVIQRSRAQTADPVIEQPYKG